MNTATAACRRIVGNPWFENFIMAVILFNSIAIGVETYFPGNGVLSALNNICLAIYTAEIFIRYFASVSLKDYLRDGWNVFNIVVVLACFIPESLMPNAAAAAALRVVRVFRVMLLFKNSREMRLIVHAMLRSVRSLGINLMVMFIFLYIFAISGVYMFRLPDPASASPEMQAKLTRLAEIAPPAPANAHDPYGSLNEAFYTLFRCMSCDDWTDLRYNLVTASEMGIINIPPYVVTIFHTLWYVISAFLLLNLVVAAVVANYQSTMDSAHEQEKKNEEEKKRLLAEAEKAEGKETADAAGNKGGS